MFGEWVFWSGGRWNWLFFQMQIRWTNAATITQTDIFSLLHHCPLIYCAYVKNSFLPTYLLSPFYIVCICFKWSFAKVGAVLLKTFLFSCDHLSHLHKCCPFFSLLFWAIHLPLWYISPIFFICSNVYRFSEQIKSW